MSTTTWARLSRVGAAAAVGALAVALLPTVAAQAVGPAAPKFAYRSVVANDVALSTNDAATAGTADQATVAGYQVYGYDASDNGRTWAACMSAGAASANSYDRTYALALTHTDGTTPTSRSLSTFCEANPVVSRNGDTVWWFADDHIYKFVPDYTDPANITGTTTVVSTGQFVRAVDAAGDPTENVLALAVSSDGLKASVMFTNGTTVRVRSAEMTTDAAKKGAVQYSTTAATALPKPSTFVYLPGTSTLMFATANTTVSPQAIKNVTLDTPANTTAGVAVGAPAVTDASLDGLYDVRPNGANLWAWKDVYTGTTFDHTQLYFISGGVATDSGTARTDGATTYSYVPVTATPPKLQPVINKAAAHPYFATSASLVGYKKRAAYSSYNLYETDPLGGAYVAGSAAEVDRGTLTYYYDGMTTYAPHSTTSGASVFAIGSRWYNGWAQLPGRTYLLKNTWFRWTFEGDYFTEKSAPITRLVKVAPVVSVRKSVSGAYKTIYGAATRAGGTAVLQKLTSRGWRTVTSAALVRKSSYSSVYTFGRRALSAGSYRVLTVADRGWALGASVAVRV